jgi:hypothetical protein
MTREINHVRACKASGNRDAGKQTAIGQPPDWMRSHLIVIKHGIEMAFARQRILTAVKALVLFAVNFPRIFEESRIAGA